MRVVHLDYRGDDGVEENNGRWHYGPSEGEDDADEELENRAGQQNGVRSNSVFKIRLRGISVGKCYIYEERFGLTNV